MDLTGSWFLRCLRLRPGQSISFRTVTGPGLITEVRRAQAIYVESRFNNSRPHFCLHLNFPSAFFKPCLAFQPLTFVSFTNMFRLFGAKRSPPPESIGLSERETEMFKDCIATTRRQIFETERRIKALNANLLTVCRCIKTRLPSFSPGVPIRLPDIFEGRDLPSPPEVSHKKSAWHMPCLHRQNAPNSVGNPKLHSPAYLIERPVVVPEDERVVAPPYSIKAKDVTSMAHGKPDLEVQLNLLVLKKAELEVDAHKLEKDLLFWGGVYEKIKFINLHYKKEEKLPSKENLPYSQFRRMPRPSPLRETPVNTEFDPWESTSTRDMGLSSSIPRKEVPIGEMLARFKTTPFNSPRPGTSRESSWFDDTDKMTVMAQTERNPQPRRMQNLGQL